MSDETERAKEIDEAVKAADAKKRADAEEAAMAGEKLDTLLKCLDSLGKRMDEWEKKQADSDDDPTAKSYPPSDMNPLNRGEIPTHRARSAPIRVRIRSEPIWKRSSTSRKRTGPLARSRLTPFSPRSSPTRTGLRRLGARVPCSRGTANGLSPIAAAPRVSIKRILPRGRMSICARYPGKH